MKYNGFKVDGVEYGGAIVNVNGTSITDHKKMTELMHSPFHVSGYSVFVEGDELMFDTFEEAYEFATTKQKDTCYL